jgi:hypothetical protein
MRRALAGLDTEQLASERILDALEPLLADQWRATHAGTAWTPWLLSLRRILRLVEARVPGTANYRPYLAHMFPRIDRVEVEQRCRQMAACLDLQGQPAIQQLEANVFRLDPA